MPAAEHTITIDEIPVFYREAAAPGSETPAPTPGRTPVYLHTAPTSSLDWTEPLERSGGIAPDLIGFGRSGKGGHLDYSPDGIARVVAALLDELGADRIALAGHGWGAAVAVALAGLDPARVERLLLVDPAPPLDGASWHRVARLWRTPLIGEIVMGSINRALLARILRRASAGSQAWPDERVDEIWRQFDQGTQRATLRLYRWATPMRAESMAAELPALDITSLLLWGEADPWLAPELADGWRSRLPRADLEYIPEAGHWPWLDCPELAERIAGFLTGS